MCTGIAGSVTTVTTTALVTLMILIIYSDSLHAILHLLAVAWFIGNSHFRQRKYTTQWGYRQGKGDKNQD